MSALRCMSVNTWRGGVRNPDGTPADRLPALCEAIAAQGPHLVGVQEAHEWAADDGRLLQEVQGRLGLTAVQDSFAPGRSTGLLYDPDAMDLKEWETVTGAESGFTGFGGTARFDVGLPYSLSVVVAHMSHQSLPLAIHQASTANDRARRVADRAQPPGAPRAEAAMIFGDINAPRLSHPAAPAEPRPEDLPAANLAYRFTGPAGKEEVDRPVAELFDRCRWTDLALHLADRTGDPQEQAHLLASTGHGGFSVDRVYVTESVVPATSGLEHVTIPSDHAALYWEVDPALIDPTLTTCLHR
ncbi:hypothetical protein KGD82_16150 [Nocardiopsis eucommiae]|uniref:Endonuclease/exonuclease/phosphatase domain-containing protein n=1 Tax=Nocardiopsis eucommiae TaxID=2831970 RepID=A0A975L7Y0_9ACTN|nr:hypothetical protein KGD82_16150 [Nocardiopsis eucommiae]